MDFLKSALAHWLGEWPLIYFSNAGVSSSPAVLPKNLLFASCLSYFCSTRMFWGSVSLGTCSWSITSNGVHLFSPFSPLILYYYYCCLIFFYNPVITPFVVHFTTVPHPIPFPQSPRGYPHLPTPPLPHHHPTRHPHSLGPQVSPELGASSLISSSSISFLLVPICDPHPSNWIPVYLYSPRS